MYASYAMRGLTTPSMSKGVQCMLCMMRQYINYIMVNVGEAKDR